MSGSPEWKPTFSARPSSVTDRMSNTITPSKAKMSPSDFYLSGRNVRPKPDSKAAASRSLARHTAEPSTSGSSASDARDRSRTPSGVEAIAPLGAPVPFRGTAPSQGSVPSIAGSARPFNLSTRAVTAPASIEMWPGGIFRPGWSVGAWFRCLNRRGLHHRVYEGPPDGTPRVRLGPDEVLVDFTRPYRVKALFCNSTFSAVQFKVTKSHSDGTTSSLRVWTNVRRDNDWWAEIVDANVGERLFPHGHPERLNEGSLSGLVVLTASRRAAPATRFSSPAPAEEAN